MASAHHALCRGAAEPEIALQVDLKDFGPVLVLHPQEQAVLGDAGVGHQDVQGRAGGGFGRLDKPVDGGGVGKIRRNRGDALAEFRGAFLQHRLAGAGEDHMGALGMESSRDGRPDAARGACDKGGLAGQFEHGGFL